MRLLLLPESLQLAVQHGSISEGHARTLLMLNDLPDEQNVLYREILLKKLSVREVERISRKIAVDKVRKKDWGNLNYEMVQIEKRLTEALGTRVQIAKTDFGGKVVIDYFSSDDLNKIIALMVEEKKQGALAAAPAAAAAVASGDGIVSAIESEVGAGGAVIETEEETPIDDRSKEEKQEEDDTDLYAVTNFSL
jgi:hypothetical protein